MTIDVDAAVERLALAIAKKCLGSGVLACDLDPILRPELERLGHIIQGQAELLTLYIERTESIRKQADAQYSALVADAVVMQRGIGGPIR